MVLYIVGDFVEEGGEIHYSGELERMLEHKPSKKDVVVISPEGYTPFGETAEITDEDLIYFGHSGKNITHIPGEEHGLIQELPRYQEMFERFKDLKFANPRELLLDNISKEYLVRLSDEPTIPTISSAKVQSLDDLMKDEDLFVKPLISERSADAYRLNDLNPDQRQILFENYVSGGFEGQGLVLQPFIPGILDHGERKVGVIGGNVTLCRLVQPDGSFTRATITDEEQEVCQKAWEYMSSNFPGAVYTRVDLIGDPKNPQINEIEAVNPNLTTRKLATPYNEREVENHYTRLLEELLK